MADSEQTSLLFFKVNVFSLQSRIIDNLCYVLVILGLIGNIFGLLIFSSSRRTWRISSMYVYLATCSSIINVLCVIRYTFVIHSRLQNILYEVVGEKWWACKIYEFSSSFRILSSWISLFWMFERLMYVSMRLRTLFNQCHLFKVNFIIPGIILLIILGCIIGPPLYMFQPSIFKNKIMNVSKRYCTLSSKASVKWKKYFYEIRFGINHFTIRCLFSELIPAGAVILFNSYIIYHVVRTYRRLNQTSGHKRQRQTISWMNIVLLIHSSLFLASLLAHIVGHLTVIQAHETWWVLLTNLINNSLNFYIYCLSGKAFRNEIRQFIQRFKRQIFHKLHIQQRQRHRHFHDQRLIDEMNYRYAIIQLKTHRPDD